MKRILPWLTIATVSLAADSGPGESFVKRTENKIFRATVKPNWLPGGQSFWYRIQTGPQTHEFVLINATTGARKTAPALKGLGLPEKDAVKTSESRLERRKTTRTGGESGLKFINKLEAAVDLFWVNQQGGHVPYGSIPAGSEREQHTYEGHVWLISSQSRGHLATVEAGATVQTLIIDGKGLPEAREEPRQKERGVGSPDGRWSARVEQGVVGLKEMATGRTAPMPTGMESQGPLRGQPVWSPDSRAFVIHRAPPTPKRRVGIVESRPQDQLQPRLKELDYVKPGDPLPKPSPVLFVLTEKGYDWHAVKPDLFPEPFTLTDHFDITWSPDSREFYFDYNQRGHQVYRILAVDAKTSAVRVVVEERSETFIHYSGKSWRHWLHGSNELLWMSERDGWCHLWLYDVKTGSPKHQITRGAWPVREVLHVDDAKREIWFLASGLRPGEDPYHEHLCRVKFDGSGFQQLTTGDGTHRVEFSPGRDFFIDTWSRVDHPPVTELRRSSDGSLVCELEKADAAALLATGWRMPERFVAKGRDGNTDIHGIIIKPPDFDPAKKHPVLENIYAGPHSAFTPKEFSRLPGHHAMAALGFIVVQMDGMGTDHRGKAFHDVCWKNLKDAGFPDRIAWIKEAAKSRPWMDLNRVGIYGGSAGGQSAMRALLDHHDFYKVAVADCGCHDNRMDKIWWNEQWMGWPVDDSYKRSSNLEDAHKLQGRLLLIVGELDTNVDPASTMQVVGALQKAGKTFDFMPIMGVGHGAAETPYGSRARAEFLVRHLQP